MAIHILHNISRSKGNQAMKVGQLIEYNMRNVFVEKSYTKCAGESIPRPLSKKMKIKNISGSIVESIQQFLFYCMLIRELSKYSEIRLQTICFYLIQSFSKKQKEVWN